MQGFEMRLGRLVFKKITEEKMHNLKVVELCYISGLD